MAKRRLTECTYKKGYLHVNMPFRKTGQNTFNNVSKLEWKLMDKGITFDTGSDFKSRDWELDWSLEGAKPKTVLNYLKRGKIKFTTAKVCD